MNKTKGTIDYGILRCRYKHPIKYLKCWLKTRHEYQYDWYMAGVIGEVCKHCDKERLVIMEDIDVDENT